MSDRRRRRTPSERCFAALLALYPHAFRSRFGDDMRELFRDQHAHARRHGGTGGVLRLWARTLPSLVRNALLEREVARREHAHTRHRMTHWVGSAPMLHSIGADVRYAGRMLRKSPVFAAVAVLVIALGSGAVTTVFSAINALVLRPLPGAAQADRLRTLQRRQAPGAGGPNRVSASMAYYRALRDGTRSMEGVAAWAFTDVTIATGAGVQAAQATLVSGDYFKLLRVRPALGRFFVPDEDRTALTHPVVVVSHAFWQARLGGDSSVVGRPIVVSGRPYTLVGVAPAEFRGVFTPIVTDAWVPLAMRTHVRPGTADDHNPWMWLFGRLRDGVSDEAARAELARLAAAHAATGAEPAWLRAFSDVETYALTGLPADARMALLAFTGLLLGIAVLVLLIASINVASMVSARAIARTREMAVRTALGAPRARLVRQLLVETLALFLLGAGGGFALAWLATRAIETMPIPAEIVLSMELSPDLRVLAFAVGMSMLTGLVVGIVPALRGSRPGIAVRLRDGGTGGGTRRGRLGGALVIAQLACSLVLLVAAGLFARALRNGATVDPHFDADGVTVTYLSSAGWAYDEPRARQFFARLRDRLAAEPGVQAVTLAGYPPLTASNSGTEVKVTGEREPFVARLASVDEGYFDVLRLPLVRGRAFTAADGAGAPGVAIVNEEFVRRHWPSGEAVGRTFEADGKTWTIVGVARDSRYENLTEALPQFVYFPVAQRWEMRQALMIRSAAGVAPVRATVASAMQAIDPQLPRPTVTTLREQQAIVLLPQRVASLVTGALGATGLLLATVGLYGVIAYSATRRTREMGIRLALGARRTDVLGLVVREGMGLALGGVVAGIALAALSTRLLASYLVGVSPLDPWTFGGMTTLFVLVALVASWLPARRAAGTDPAVALRSGE